MDNKESQHCWEFHNCPEEVKMKCPAHMYSDEKCWIIASSFCGRNCPKVSAGGGG